MSWRHVSMRPVRRRKCGSLAVHTYFATAHPPWGIVGFKMFSHWPITLRSLLNNWTHGWGLSSKSFPSSTQCCPVHSGPEGCFLSKLSITSLLTGHLTSKKWMDEGGVKEPQSLNECWGAEVTEAVEGSYFLPKNIGSTPQESGQIEALALLFAPTPTLGLWIKYSEDFLSIHLLHLNRRYSIFNMLNLL